MSIESRGQLTSVRKPGLDPRVGYEIAKLIRSIPSITQGPEFPASGVRFGDQHFFTGEDNVDFKKNNWYIKTPNASPANGWQSMNATALNPANIQTGTIPTGVKVADYMPLTGGTFAGVITFAQSQTFPAERIAPGILQPGVLVTGCLPINGGAMQGQIDMTNHSINSIKKLLGVDDALYIDMATDGTMALVSDSAMTLTALTIALTGTISLTGTVTLSTLNVDSGVLYVDAANNRVGINDISPDFDLDLNGSIRLQTGKYLYFGGTGAADNDTNLYRSAANVLKTDDKLVVVEDVEVGSTKGFYIGDATTNGSWRIVLSGANLVIEKRETGAWVTKGTIQA